MFLFNQQYLKPEKYIDSDHPVVSAYSEKHVRSGVTEVDKAIRFYYAIMDGIQYNTYIKVGNKTVYLASCAVLAGEEWCVLKAALMEVCLRINGIRVRPGYSDVKNHAASKGLIDLLGSEIFLWHSYREVYLEVNRLSPPHQ